MMFSHYLYKENLVF